MPLSTRLLLERLCWFDLRWDIVLPESTGWVVLVSDFCVSVDRLPLDAPDTGQDRKVPSSLSSFRTSLHCWSEHPRLVQACQLTFLKMIGSLMLGPRIPAAHIHNRSQYRQSRCCRKGTPRKCQRGEGLGHQEQGQKVRELQRSGLMWHWMWLMLSHHSQQLLLVSPCVEQEAHPPGHVRLAQLGVGSWPSSCATTEQAESNDGDLQCQENDQVCEIQRQNFTAWGSSGDNL